MKKIIFIIGAVRSGKSRFALQLAKQKAGAGRAGVVFLATCRPKDREMKERVRRHKISRPSSWQTIEEPLDIAAAIKRVKGEKVIILDCLTLWLSNLLCAGAGEKEMLKKTKELAAAALGAKCSLIIVSNEVGWGIVPENKMARLFRDIAGTAHQELAKICDEVYLMVAGISLKVK